MRLVFLGPPGAGKGTVAKILSRKYEIPHVSTGDILRARTQDGSALGRKAKEYVDQGKLVPDEVVIEMVMERLGDREMEEGFILDGFPRTEAQARALDDGFRERNLRIDHAVYFVLSEKTLVERLSNRRTCGRCGEIYHLKNIRPQAEGVCDRCGGPLVQRADDKEEAIRERLRVYERETAPLVQFYRGRLLLREVTAEMTAEKVVEQVETILK